MNALLMQSRLVRIGNFFFSYRNRLFPLITLGLFALAAPPAEIFGSTTLEHLKDVTALVIVLTGIAFRLLVIGFVYIKRGGLNKKVYAETLVTHGIFGLCRNPLYIGNLLICLGVFLMHGNFFVMALGMTTYLFIYQCIVLAEEAYLEKKFGESYQLYCQDVPRWIPKVSNFQRATQGTMFNLPRALIRDYSTIAMAIITLALTEGYEELTVQSPSAGAVASLASIIVCVAMMAGIIRFFKKASGPAAKDGALAPELRDLLKRPNKSISVHRYFTDVGRVTIRDRSHGATISDDGDGTWP